ncbi:amino acid adenylation domain-containing protein [Scytonema sp. UIC 10036]|uniref:non-ribosomal peptide synthetase n=1 Tax=Scytonema sp. UIC 10036 TaxID=2304196 RepID=UPI0012DA8CE5|nr:non-ribosomal peptide synthetase [Scytonema sp. UIC 10036]MUG96207.1 amino acid adenylation domain-containing protein [Scytonema sp. UIC 10036]
MTDFLNEMKVPTLVSLLQYRAQHQPNKLAFTFLRDGETESASLTYQELDRQARAIATYLQSIGATGGNALLLYPPGLEFVAAFFGCLYAGVVAVPAYPPRANQSLFRLQAIVADARAVIALTTTTVLSNIEQKSTEFPALKTLRWIATNNLEANLEQEWQEPVLTKDTLAFLQYTSGSTGIPKGVILSHGHLLHNSAIIQKCFEHTPNSQGVIWLPPYHDMGLIGGVLQPLYTGFPVTLMSPVDFLQRPLRWLQAISQYKATTSGGPNFAYDLCVRKITLQERETLDLSSWSVAFNGAEPIHHETLERFAQTFAQCGFRQEAFYPCYGLAEATLLVSGGKKADPPTVKTFQSSSLEQNQVVETSEENEGIRRLIGCGQNLLNQKIVVVDPKTLTPCLSNQIGEIWVNSPSVAGGYWNRPEETKHTFGAYLNDTKEGPFLRTGDLGFLHSGELYITGRLKDLIVIRGRNHYPQDIELTVEQSHVALQPGCSAASSINMAGEEKLVVVVEVKRSYLRSLDVPQVIAAIRQAVAENHELQVYGVLLLKPGSIPKTSSGKIQRHACRAGFFNESLHIVGSSVLEETYAIESKENLTREALLAIEPKDRKPLLESYIRDCVARVLKIAPSQLDLQQPLSFLGLDSLMAIELQHSIETDLSVVLPMTSFLQGDSIAQLASTILTQLTAFSFTEATTLTSAKNIDTQHPLSYGQRALWFLHQLAPESVAYNIVSAVRLHGELDIAALQRAFGKLVERHPALRTTFCALNGEPIQQVHQHSSFHFQTQDVSSWSEEFLNERLLEEAHRPFNLERGPLMRVNLFARSSQEHILLLAIHHIISDIWSLAVFVEELGILYQAEKNGILVSLPMLMPQYGDRARWQADMLASPQGDRHWAYWQQQLARELPILNLQTDRPRPPVQTYRGATVPFKLNAELTQRLKALSRVQGATLYMTLLAAYQMLLSRYTGQKDILVGSPTTGRSRADLAGLVGYFVNPVVLRAHLSGKMSFEAFLGQVKQTVLNAFEHQDYPFALLVKRLQPVRDPSCSPLFQTMFVLEKAHLQKQESLASFALGVAGARMHMGELEMESMALDVRVAQFDLTLMMAEVGEELIASLEYNTDLFEADTIARMAGHFQTLLESIVTNPRQSISTLPLLTPAEKHQMLVEWNNTKTDYPQQCIHELFAAQVERTPDAVAVVFENKQLTYRELNSRANQLAHHLQSFDVGSDVLVGICMERSLEMVVGVLGILKAGGAYVPLDPTYPKERLAFMLKDTEATILLTQQNLVASLPEHKARVICLDANWEMIAQNSADNPTGTATPANLAYIIYTSGSTGQPKGVMIPHQGIVNRLVSGIMRYQLAVGARVLQKTSFSFDVSVWEIFGSLLSGACLVMAQPGGQQDPSYLVRVMAEQQITLVDFVPSMLQMILDQPGLDACTALRYVTCGGEALPLEVRDRFFARLCGVELHNCYGPSEVSIDATYWVCDRLSSVISIGRPLANQQVYILDEHLQPVPIGVPGELYIGGVGLAHGYLNRPDLTAEKFIPHPFSDEPGARLYKTGDLALYLPDAQIKFLGRLDDQVKVRGFRLELGEIEATLRRHPSIEEASVLMQYDTNTNASRQRLLAYLVPKSRHQQIEFWPSVGEYPLYDELLYHAMTHDEERNQSYEYAINELVRDRVVVEIGTGQDAILARLCVAAGAKKVYAIEGSKEAYNCATALVKRLGLEDKIILIHGYSQEVNLPEKVDVCVSEIIGTIGGSEGVAAILNDARRFLKEDGCMIPHRSLTKIAAVSLPDELQNPIFHETPGHYVQQIFTHLGHPFDLRLCIKNFPQANIISDTDIFEDLNFSDFTETEYSRKITLKIAKLGRLDGFLLWLNLYTAPGVLINSIEQQNSNWLPVYFPVFYPGIEVYPGDTIEAMCIGHLSDNNVNPDYRIQGYLIRQNGETIVFAYDSLHHQQPDKRSPFYELLFPQGKINLDKSSQQLSAKSLRTYLSRYLPDYMIPGIFVTIAEMPRTPNGKIDYRALPTPDTVSFEQTETYVPPSTALEAVLATMWNEILQIERVGIHDNFFELGGHSLLAIQVLSKIRDVFRVELPLHSLFEAATVAKLSQIMLTHETKPGQMEKIAEIFQKITAMSAKDVQTTLHLKKSKEV